jgi:photosystem II stability/assembly factor-like uncharacterized protein
LGALDFRGVQAWDEKTAIVMASGPWEKSRLYKTVDGCRTWKLVFRNPDKDGFWDAIRITGQKTVLLAGDPVPAAHSHGIGGKKIFQFPIYATLDRAETWMRLETEYLLALSDESGKPAETLFAASNSALLESAGHEWILFVTGGQHASLKLLEHISNPNPAICRSTCWVIGGAKLNMATGQSAGAFSLDARIAESSGPKLVIVGGDYAKPEVSEGTSTTCEKDPNMLLSTVFKCTISSFPPHGFRSAVQWSEPLKVWITAGTNGSDISRDDGRTWKPLDDVNWNALSLPFVVGPGGRIGRLNEGALPKP